VKSEREDDDEFKRGKVRREREGRVSSCQRTAQLEEES